MLTCSLVLTDTSEAAVIAAVVGGGVTMGRDALISSSLFCLLHNNTHNFMDAFRAYVHEP